jgi:hypothetical protein
MTVAISLLLGCTSINLPIETDTSIPRQTPIFSPTSFAPIPTPEETSERSFVTFKTVENINLDNDGLSYMVEILSEDEDFSGLIILNIKLGNGQIYSEEIQPLSGSEDLVTVDTVDLTGDGNNELIIVLEGGGYETCYILVYTINDKGEIEKLPMPMENSGDNGYEFKINYKDDFKFDVLRSDGTMVFQNQVLSDEQKEEFISREYYAEDGKLIFISLGDWGWTDMFQEYKIIECNGMNALQIPQYICYSSHADGLGEVVSIISWPNDELKLLYQYFSTE